MLSQAHLGKMKMEKKKNNVRLTKKQVTRQSHAVHQGNSGGLVSSIVFAPHQGIELVNPDYIAEMGLAKPVQEYFKPESGFKTVLAERKIKNAFEA